MQVERGWWGTAWAWGWKEKKNNREGLYKLLRFFFGLASPFFKRENERKLVSAMICTDIFSCWRFKKNENYSPPGRFSCWDYFQNKYPREEENMRSNKPLFPNFDAVSHWWWSAPAWSCDCQSGKRRKRECRQGTRWNRRKDWERPRAVIISHLSLLVRREKRRRGTKKGGEGLKFSLFSEKRDALKSFSSKYSAWDG